MENMNKTIEELIKKELEDSNIKHGCFNSQHEGYAVLLEEVEEAKTEIDNCEEFLSDMWALIKKDKKIESFGYPLQVLRVSAVDLAKEAIQIAAMCDKFVE